MTLPNPRRSLHKCGVTMRESRLRHTGISVVGDMPWGTHFCHFYDSKQDLLDTLVPYFKAGLDDKEFCVWVIADPLTKEEAWNALRIGVPDLDRHLADQSIEMFVGEEWYLKDDTFNLERVISAWNEKLEQALARGYEGMRVSGDTCWLRKKDWQDFCAYENHLNESISDQAMTVLCTYPLAKSGAAEILDVARTHQFCLIRRSGNWEVIETPEIKLAKREISKLNEDLERRVDERTEQLLDANEQLRNEIAERNQAEGLLREANEKVKMVLDSITDRFFAFDSEWRYTYFNRHAEEQLKALGKDPTTIIGKVLWEEFPNPPIEEAVRRAMSERIVITDEHYYAPLGDWIENRFYPSPDGGLAIFQRSVTERKRVEEELRRSEAYLAEGQNISHTGSWAWNVKTGDLFWSLEHFRIFGLDPEKVKLTYEMVVNCVHPEDRSLLQETFENAVRNGDDYELDFRIVRPDGIRHIHSLAHAVFDENGTVVEYVGTVIDTTERKRGEEALRHAHAELAHASRVLTMGELTSSIAHEVNQPLGAIVTNGNASLRLISRNPPAVERSREAIECMISDAMRASEVIKRIRAMLKKSVPEKTLLNMNETIHDVIGLTASQLANSQIALRTNLAPDRLMVLGDRVQLQQVMLNLILNSNEAMSKPGWQFRELVIGSQLTKPNEITVEVRDSGLGFEPGNQDRIFDAFVTSKDGGLGLGLSISRTIIEAHGGRLWGTANEGPGATFQFTLPTSNGN
jgi:PAS domain S-box-containing protein